MGKKEKTLVIIVIICIIILIGIIIGIFFNKNKINSEQNEIENYTSNEIETNEQNQNIIENEVEESIIKEQNTTQNSNIENLENVKNEQTTKENTNQVIGKEEQESNKEESGKNNDEKALQLAKEKWGDDEEGVKFVIDRREGSKYTISVRDINTTAAIIWYTVDVDAETVD